MRNFAVVLVRLNDSSRLGALRAPRGLLVFCGFIVLCGAGLAAQVAMPDPSQISGVPLPAPELPAGTVSVRVVRERMGNNIADQRVTLNVGGQSRTGTTDQQGRAEFTGIAVGATAVASVTVDGETITSQPLPLPAKGGVRVALIAGITEAAARDRASAEAAAKEAPRQGVVVLGGESRVILEFQDDTPTVFYLLDIVNSARTPIDTGAPLDFVLPAGARNPTLMEGSSRQATLRGDVVRVTGPFAPGTTNVQIGFSLPDAGQNYTLRQAWPAAFERVFVAVEKTGDVQAASPQLPATETLNAEGGKTFILASGGRLNPGDELVVNMSGLPAHSMTPRYVAIGLALAILATGLFVAVTSGKKDATEELRRERDRLMRELVAIDQRRAAGKPKAKDAERRPAFVASLERVLAALDEAPDGGRGAAA